jgi:hypothetical protein
MNDASKNTSKNEKSSTRRNGMNAHRSFLQELKLLLDANTGSYRLLYTEPKSLDSQYYFVGLNPGGQETDPSDLYVESGNAILNENWAGTKKNPLQNQMIYFFEDMAKVLGRTDDWMPYMNTEWMISNYVFYRSPSWDTMAKKHSHISTSKEIWRKIFTKNVPKVIVANGYETHEHMVSLLQEFGWIKKEETRSCKAWDGPHLIVLQLGDRVCLTVGFAHLSRFPIIRREKNKECIQGLYQKIKEFTAKPSVSQQSA